MKRFLYGLLRVAGWCLLVWVVASTGPLAYRLADRIAAAAAHHDGYFIVSVVIVIAAAIVGWYRFHVRLRAKGYHPFFISVCLFAVLSFCYDAFFQALPTNTSDALEVSLPPIAWILLAAALVRVAPNRLRRVSGSVAPNRLRRVSGPRRPIIPYLWLGRSTIAFGIAFCAFFVWQFFGGDEVPRNEAWQGLLGTGLFFTLGLFWLRLGRRVKTAPTVLPKLEVSVLYLRAFSDDKRPFAVGTASKLRGYTGKFKAKAAHSYNILRLTLEEFLDEEFSAQIGPLVALGNPLDRLPPEGAIREYAPDPAWRDRLVELARMAACVVIDPGQSDNLQWELTHIRAEGMSRKLCLFTPPRIAHGTNFFSSWKDLRSEARRRNALASSWAVCTEGLRRAGYECDLPCPGPGAAVSFDETGKGVLLTTEARTPADYVTPVADWIKNGTKTGRCIPGACASCGTAIYVSHENSKDDGPAFCFTCGTKPQLSAKKGLETILAAVIGVTFTTLLILTQEELIGLWTWLLIIGLGICAFGIDVTKTWLRLHRAALADKSPPIGSDQSIGRSDPTDRSNDSVHG
jgi:hypothetical protein